MIFKIYNKTIEVESEDWNTSGEVKIDAPEKFIKELLLQDAITGGTPAIHSYENGMYYALPVDVDFALTSMGVEYEITGNYVKSETIIDSNKIY